MPEIFDGGEAPISQWSRGFVAGYQWLEETWGEYVPNEHDDEFGSLVMVLSFFSSRRFAEAVRDEMYAPKKSLAAVASTMRGLLPEAATEFARLGRMIGAMVARAEAEAHTPRRASRLDPMHPARASGRKYKKCCGAVGACHCSGEHLPSPLVGQRWKCFPASRWTRRSGSASRALPARA